jgi:GntR family transcriptional regulator / MocR family aminotransferase
MSLTRRLDLLDWATRNRTWILEDDYDSEYRYVSRPLACLQGMEDHARVIYVGTFSKVLFPALRVGYLVVPKLLVNVFATAREHSDVFPPTLTQAALADFIAEGHFVRHLRRMRSVYQERLDILLEELKPMLGRELSIAHAESGMHVTAFLPDGRDDLDLAEKASAARVCFTPLSLSYTTKAARPGLILGFGGADPKSIRSGVRSMKTILNG